MDPPSSLNMLDDLTLIFFTALLQMWISGLCIEDLSQMTGSVCLWIPYHKTTLLTCCVIRNRGVKFWTIPPLSVWVTPVSFLTLNKQLCFHTGRLQHCRLQKGPRFTRPGRGERALPFGTVSALFPLLAWLVCVSAVVKPCPKERIPLGRGRTQGSRAGTRCFTWAFREGCWCVFSFFLPVKTTLGKECKQREITLGDVSPLW